MRNKHGLDEFIKHALLEEKKRATLYRGYRYGVVPFILLRCKQTKSVAISLYHHNIAQSQFPLLMPYP